MSLNQAGFSGFVKKTEEPIYLEVLMGTSSHTLKSPPGIESRIMSKPIFEFTQISQ